MPANLTEDHEAIIVELLREAIERNQARSERSGRVLSLGVAYDRADL